MTNMSCPNSPFEGYPLWGKSWRRRSTLNISYLNGVYKDMIVFLAYLTKLETNVILNFEDILINDWMVERNGDGNRVRLKCDK